MKKSPAKMQLAFVDLGEQQLKNIAQPVRVYRISDEHLAAGRRATARPDKCSIAVLPFTNMSGDTEQKYFALTERLQSATLQQSERPLIRDRFTAA